MPFEATKPNSLVNLVSVLKEHPVINNDFLRLWMTEKLSLKQIKIFARNYWEWTYRFPEALASLIKNTEKTELRVEYTKILHSEMGEGNYEKAHVILFENYIQALTTTVEPRNHFNIKLLLEEIPLIEELELLLKGQNILYNSKTPIAVGAQLAIEWQAYSMIRKLYEGARIYRDLWEDQDKFHEACEFFYIHIGTAEKEHKLSSLTSASLIINNDETIQEIEYGFYQHLNLIEKFWVGLYNIISRS